MSVPVVAFLFALAVGLILYILLVPRNDTPYNPPLDQKDKKLQLLSLLTEEFNNSLPKGVGPLQQQNRRYPKIESLLVRSGNPWGLNAQEFVFTQWTFGLIGFVLAWPVWALLKNVINIPWFLLVPALTILLFFYPYSKYSSIAKERDFEFKRELPEALDLLIISLSAGTTFSQALRDSIPNMPDGILKDEFERINQSLNAGTSLEESLDSFGRRAPNEAISSFVKAVREATKLDVPLIEILEARAAASRQEYFALIHNRTAKLPSKLWMILTPTLIPALLIIAVTPSVFSLLESLGG